MKHINKLVFRRWREEEDKTGKEQNGSSKVSAEESRPDQHTSWGLEIKNIYNNYLLQNNLFSFLNNFLAWSMLFKYFSNHLLIHPKLIHPYTHPSIHPSSIHPLHPRRKLRSWNASRSCWRRISGTLRSRRRSLNSSCNPTSSTARSNHPIITIII